MDEPILIPVEYQGEILEIPVTVASYSYTYQLHMQVEGQSLIFEKDDEGRFRVINMTPESSKIDKGLIQAIVDTIAGAG